MNYISLFSSAGIGCYGLLQEGFEGIASSELLSKRLDIQKANDKLKYSDGYILGDIREAHIKSKLYKAIENYKQVEEIDDIDVVVFTPPCQGMSVANHKKNENTIETNSLVSNALEIVSEIKPKFFISENVRSFMNTACYDRGRVKKISQAFEEYLGEDYLYESRIINFKNHGANSSRTRTLVIGVRLDLVNVISPDALYPNETEEKTLLQVIGHLESLNNMGQISKKDIYHNFKKYREDMREWIKGVKAGFSAFDNEDLLKKPHSKDEDGNIVINTNKNGDKYKRQRWDYVAPCIHTRNDILSSQNTVHPVDDRVFSIREIMLMMNVPSSFKWSDMDEKELNKLSCKNKELYLKNNEMNIRQSLGEAIPTVIIQKIAKNIKEVLNK